MSINIKNIVKDIEDVVLRVEGKLPADIEQAATWGDKYVGIAETFLTSGTALDFTAIVPEAEPLRESVVAILTELEVVFKAVEGAYKKTALLTANANLIIAKVPGVSLANAVTSAQLVRESGKVPTV